MRTVTRDEQLQLMEDAHDMAALLRRPILMATTDPIARFTHAGSTPEPAGTHVHARALARLFLRLNGWRIDRRARAAGLTVWERVDRIETYSPTSPARMVPSLVLFKCGTAEALRHTFLS